MSLGQISTGPALNSLAFYQQKLTQASNQASSGNRITNASIDPSGLAIYNALESQAQGADTANQNISQASDAINVAQGATSGIQDALGQLQNLAIEAGNGFNSASDNAALQTQANALVQQINTDAGTVNFNGTALLTGQNSGTTPATAASATTTSNDLVNSGGNVVTTATASAATTSGTIGVTIANTGAGAVANVTFTDSTTQQVTNVGQFAAGSTVNVNGTSVTLGQFTTSDTNSTATANASRHRRFGQLDDRRADGRDAGSADGGHDSRCHHCRSRHHEHRFLDAAERDQLARADQRRHLEARRRSGPARCADRVAGERVQQQQHLVGQPHRVGFRHR